MIQWDKNSDLTEFHSDLMGFIVIQWDINGIYPLVSCRVKSVKMYVES